MRGSSTPSATADDPDLLLCIVEPRGRHRADRTGQAGGCCEPPDQSPLRRVSGLAACGLIITGCSSGQISQTADQESAVNGSTANVKNIALRNVHLQAVQTGDYLKPGRTVELVFAAVNTSADVNDKLLGITSDVGSVSITGDLAIPANSALIVGSADRTTEASPLSSTEDAKAEVTLSQPITNGLTYGFTFTFDKAGEAKIQVPISAGAAPVRKPPRPPTNSRRPVGHLGRVSSTHVRNAATGAAPARRARTLPPSVINNVGTACTSKRWISAARCRHSPSPTSASRLARGPTAPGPG